MRYHLSILREFVKIKAIQSGILFCLGSRGILSLCLAGLFLISCKNEQFERDSQLLEALKTAGKNRAELENVLNHYSDPKDSLKYQAAVFLIKYMPGKYAKVYSEYDSYKPVFDTLASLNKEYEKIFKPNNAEFYKFYKATVINDFIKTRHINISREPKFEIKKDIETITSNFLIENIDYAFRAWDMPWNKGLNFTDFCEYILPYRYGTEELQPWRKIFYEANVHLLDSFRTEHDLVKVTLAVKGINDISRSEMNVFKSIAGSIRVLDLIRINSTTSCFDESGVTMIKLRALGIPMARISFPNWGNWGTGHDIIGILTQDKEWLPLHEGANPNRYNPPFKIAKAFVELYSTNRNSNAISSLGGVYTINLNYADVTKYTTNVTDLNIPYPKIKNGTIASLCVFNNKEWKPIAGSTIQDEHALFPQVGRNVIYIAGIMSDKELKPIGVPFFLDSSGVMVPIVASPIKHEIVLSRKYPPNVWLFRDLKGLNGCYFQGSNDSLFSKAKTLWKVDSLPNLQPLRKALVNSRFQYVRLVLPSIKRQMEGLGGFQVYGEESTKDPLSALPISSTKASATFYKNVFDNSALTFTRLLTRNNVDFAQFFDGENLVIPDEQAFWIGEKFKEKKNITFLELSPRTDDNDINPGETYELLYWGKDDWISAGQKQASTNKLTFDVPQNALYLLINSNKGKEHRIFLYRNDKVIWF